jgi:two-component system, cell cycle response regulator CpdR
MARAKDALISPNHRFTAHDPRAAATLMSIRILYVEDNQIVREVTTELLAQEQRQIVACATAEQAIEAFASQPFDVVITDVSLPVMSGIELARSILALKPLMPIIIASGYDLDFGIENWGPNVRSIIKPFEADEIEALIGELIRRQSG